MRRRITTWRDGNAAQTPPIQPEAKQFFLTTSELQTALPHGELVIGRDDDCHIVVNEMLVSRRHARLLVSRASLFIEDLRSTNGVLVNELRISGPTPLSDGDRLIVGTQEYLVRVQEDPAATLPPTAKSTEPPPRSPLARKISGQLASPAIEISMVPDAADQEPAWNTEKQDGLLTMARVADRMISMGRNDAAVRVLGDHLRNVVARAKEGALVPVPVREAAAFYAAKLSQVTGSGEWADLALELYLTTRGVLPEKALVAVEPVVALVDPALLRRYQAVVSELTDGVPPSERALATRILNLSRA